MSILILWYFNYEFTFTIAAIVKPKVQLNQKSQIQGSQMRWAERRLVGAPTIFKIHVQISIIYVG